MKFRTKENALLSYLPIEIVKMKPSLNTFMPKLSTCEIKYQEGSSQVHP